MPPVRRSDRVCPLFSQKINGFGAPSRRSAKVVVVVAVPVPTASNNVVTSGRNPISASLQMYTYQRGKINTSPRILSFLSSG